jgi:hypothetical protein
MAEQQSMVPRCSSSTVANQSHPLPSHGLWPERNWPPGTREPTLGRLEGELAELDAAAHEKNSGES